VRVGEELERVAARSVSWSWSGPGMQDALSGMAREEEAHQVEAATAEAERPARGTGPGSRGPARRPSHARRVAPCRGLEVTVKVASERERRDGIGESLRRVEEASAAGGAAGPSVRRSHRRPTAAPATCASTWREPGRRGPPRRGALPVREVLGPSEPPTRTRSPRPGRRGRGARPAQAGRGARQAAGDAAPDRAEQALELTISRSRSASAARPSWRHELLRFHSSGRPGGGAAQARRPEGPASAWAPST